MAIQYNDVTASKSGAPNGGGFYNDILTLKLGDAAAQWVAVAATGDVPAARERGALAAVGQQLLLYGGGGGAAGWQSDLDRFDPSTGAWTAVTVAEGTMPAGRYKVGGAAVVGCSVFYYGGRTASGLSSELMRYEADPAVTQCGEQC